MEKYTLQGMHCANCAKKLEARLQQLKHGETVHLNFTDKVLYVPKDVDINAVKKIVGADKVLLDTSFASVNKKESHQHQHSEKDKHHHHHHHVNHGQEASKNMQLVFVLNLLFSLAEFIFGVLFNSAAILSDAVHDLGDSLSIGLAWLFQKISTKEANEKYSFGHRRFSLLGALTTSIVLIIGSVLVIIHSVPLLFNPQTVNSQGMFWMAIIAIGINGFATWLMSKGSSANEKVLSLHMLEDVLGWAGVLIVSVVLRYREWYILDPLLSIGIALFILTKTIPNFLSSANVFLESVPEDVDIHQLGKEIRKINHVHGVSHLHMWSIDGEENAFAVTVYVSTEDVNEFESIREQIRLLLKENNVTHSTIEVVVDMEKLIR
ncbi:cation diffusion facilitator family transporter [Desemzia sp. RIT804]|uniref:cation diffusion facilitator family transporter n=1 Tax=Desemzia sp. RIT 804 TaxID=2810209 RepID=UPI001950203C|nr:cation transporter [Desemzia sp. RIT 804]MBM6615677.1 cation diffusion facilitator family transporter [Desemzia sp. RIT 804]